MGFLLVWNNLYSCCQKSKNAGTSQHFGARFFLGQPAYVDWPRRKRLSRQEIGHRAWP